MGEINNFPKRKPVRHAGFDYSRRGSYFLTICVKNRRCLLSQIVEDTALGVPQNQLTDVGLVVEKYILSTNNIKTVSVDNYVIMPNHVHLIVSITPSDIFDDGLGTPRRRPLQLIPSVVSSFKRFCRAEIGEDLFQRSYHDRRIRNQEEYELIWNYIVNNPMYWKKDRFYFNDEKGE